MFIIYVTPVAFHIFVVIKKRLKKKKTNIESAEP